MSVARMASVANTLPCVLASYKKKNKAIRNVGRRTGSERRVGGYSADDGVVGGGHFVEDAVDALQFLFTLRRHSVVRLVVKLHRTTL